MRLKLSRASVDEVADRVMALIVPVRPTNVISLSEKFDRHHASSASMSAA
jgi:hypothetical protein